MAVMAHPDDETFFTAGTLALYSSRGYRVILVTATKGEEGEIHDPLLETHEPIEILRDRELACACTALGLHGPYYLGYRDSGMAGTPANQRPDSFHMADPDEATGKVVGWMRTLRPQVVVTFDPDGGYGHPDHIKAHLVAARAFRLSGQASAYPEQGIEPWQPQKLYYVARPRRFYMAIAAAMRQAGMDPSEWHRNYENRGVPDEYVTTEIDVSETLPAKLEAFKCHRTQISPNGWLSKVPPEVHDHYMRTEYFWRAVPEGRVMPIEVDLFDGISPDHDPASVGMV